MKILSKSQIYEADLQTAKRQKISSSELMERAGTQIFNWIHTKLQNAKVPIHVFCGIGNNGGDGLVLARHLLLHKYTVHTYIVNYSDKRTKDFLFHYDKIKSVAKNWPAILGEQSVFPEIQKNEVVVDAIFGIGLNRTPKNWVQNLFQHFRESKAFTLSVDIPSGLYTDRPIPKEQKAVFAHHTLSFQTPKLVFFLPNTARYTTSWELVDIGMDREYLSTVETKANVIGKYEVLPMYIRREKFAHKGDFGHVLVIGGSYGKIGAVILATKAALKVGAGLVTAYTPQCGYSCLQTAIPEVMVQTDVHPHTIEKIDYDLQPSAIAIGVGMGTDNKTVIAFEAFLTSLNTPIVVDADALNILAKNKKLLHKLPALSILTPHQKELERIIGTWADDFEKLEKISAFSTSYNCIVICKGANTITVYRDKYYINTTGNPGLATAGTGDVLTGIVTGLLAQGYPPLHAAIFGVYLHGVSADIAVKDTVYETFVASDGISYLSKAFLHLFEQPKQNKAEGTN